ncbi:unnamed protein product [Malus baccata var. baccata]
MASSAQLRLMSDLRTIINDPPEGCSASPLSDDNLMVWSATVFGPDETPWEGGVFSLRLTFSERYPEKPPRVRFTSEIFHPNVYRDGSLCMDIIQDAWSPCHNVSTILTSVQVILKSDYSFPSLVHSYYMAIMLVNLLMNKLLQSLLTDPNAASPANPDAAHMYQHDIQAYNKRVRRCARHSIESLQ